ncbi:M20 family metallopeptidase [[Eubacterium] cellulosolvens]
MVTTQSIDRDFVVDLLKDMVATNSVNPTVGRGPGESAVSDLIYDRLTSISGLEVLRQSVADGRSNVVAILRGSGGRPSLMLNGHMDTVGIEGMTIDPFRPLIENGRLHGRGACDMKGALAAMIGALNSLAESQVRLRGDLIFTAVVDEEYKSVGIKKLVEEYSADAAVVGEPSEMKVATAHKGFVWIEVEVKGRAAHGSVPEKGVDAIAHAAKVVSRLEKLQERLGARVHPLLGSAKIHTSTIEGGTDWSIIPERCLLRVERRTLPGESAASVVSEIEEILQGIKHETDDFNSTARSPYDMPPLETAPDAQIVQALRKALVEVRGTQGPVIGLPFWTDGALISKLASIPTCIFGPGDIGVAHSACEYIGVEDVLDSAQVYRTTAQRFCS